MSPVLVLPCLPSQHIMVHDVLIGGFFKYAEMAAAARCCERAIYIISNTKCVRNIASHAQAMLKKGTNEATCDGYLEHTHLGLKRMQYCTVAPQRLVTITIPTMQ